MLFNPVIYSGGSSSGGDIDINNILWSLSSGTVNYAGSETGVWDKAAWFAQDNLETVSLPSAKFIGSSAFYNCQKLSHVNFPNVQFIDSGAFFQCFSLIETNFPECLYVGNGAFYNCINLKSIHLPKCLKIDINAFYSLGSRYSDYGLTTCYAPNCRSIGERAFYFCTELSSITLHSDLNYIPSWAFQDCQKLSSFSFQNVLGIGEFAFYYCQSLSSIDLPICSRINNSAFAQCYRLTDLSILHTSLIGVEAFRSTSIQSLTISTLNRSFRLSNSCFGDCLYLSTVDIYLSADQQATAKEWWIESYAFRNCIALHSVKIHTTHSSWIIKLKTSAAFLETPLYSLNSSAGFYFPSSIYSLYYADSVWSWFRSIMYSY